MSRESRHSLNKVIILIVLGTFTLLQVLYLPDEYTWAWDAFRSLLAIMH